MFVIDRVLSDEEMNGEEARQKEKRSYGYYEEQDHLKKRYPIVLFGPEWVTLIMPFYKHVSSLHLYAG